MDALIYRQVDFVAVEHTFDSDLAQQCRDDDKLDLTCKIFHMQNNSIDKAGRWSRWKVHSDREAH